LWAAYERAVAAGRVDPARAHWWEVFGTVRWGIICHNQAWRHFGRDQVDGTGFHRPPRRRNRGRLAATLEERNLRWRKIASTASEPLAAITDFLREEATPVPTRPSPGSASRMRVAVNALAILEREARLGL
jgi:hypothetical protein